MTALHAKDALLNSLETLAEELGHSVTHHQGSFAPKERILAHREISDEDEHILNEIYNEAYALSGDDDSSDHLHLMCRNCQRCLDNRWPELHCEYDDAVVWLCEALGLSTDPPETK